MTARRVHAVLAAGVQNPDLIARWQKDPQFLLGQGIQPDTIDLAALWKFAGLTTKVRHNGVRQELPMTFRLMALAGLEIEIFASYATFCASKGQRFAGTPEGRTRDLITFLEHWLDFRLANHTLVWDVIRHERALTLLNKSVPSPSVSTVDHNGPSQHLPSGSSLPVVRGETILYEMQCDPRAVESALFQREPQLSLIPLTTRHYCYWRSDKTSGIQILELDEFGYYALSLIDGVRSAAALSLQLGGSRRPTRKFLRSLSQLSAIGILDFEPPPSRTSVK
jgi:hypothetical protein